MLTVTIFGKMKDIDTKTTFGVSDYTVCFDPNKESVVGICKKQGIIRGSLIVVTAYYRNRKFHLIKMRKFSDEKAQV